MNPRQRRGVLLLALALAGAVVVFVAIARYVGSVRSEVGPKADVLVLTRDLNAYTPLGTDAVKRVQVPRRWIPPGSMVTSAQELAGKVAASNLPSGVYLERGMLTYPPDLRPGQRAITAPIEAGPGVSERLHPGTVTDLFATFPQQDGKSACAARIISRALVLSVRPRDNDRLSVTFALSGRDGLRLAYAQSFANRIGIALISDAGDDGVPRLAAVCGAPFAR
ncbi:MAG TPA: Flp pilus assembly protein CpaB [Actinoallomurus sp.]